MNVDDEYRIVEMDLPPGVNGCIVKKDDFCTICINARLASDQKKRAAIHELMHYRLGHMDDYDTTVKVKEDEIKHLPGVKNEQVNANVIEEWNSMKSSHAYYITEKES